MGTTRPLFAIGALLGVTFGVVAAGLAPRSAEAADAARPQGAEVPRLESSSTSSPASFLAAETSFDERGEAASPNARAALPLSPPPDGLEDGERLRQPAGDYSWKYAGASEERLKRALASLEHDQSLRAEVIAHGRIARGRSRELPLQGSSPSEVLRPLRREGVLLVAFAVPSGAAVEENDVPPGTTALRVVEIVCADEIALAEQSVEVDWLRSALAGGLTPLAVSNAR